MKKWLLIIALLAGVGSSKTAQRMDNGEQEKECSICLEPLNNEQPLQSAECMDTFHTGCLIGCITDGQGPNPEEQLLCPVCRYEQSREFIQHLKNKNLPLAQGYLDQLARERQQARRQQIEEDEAAARLLQEQLRQQENPPMAQAIAAFPGPGQRQNPAQRGDQFIAQERQRQAELQQRMRAQARGQQAQQDLDFQFAQQLFQNEQRAVAQQLQRRNMPGQNQQQIAQDEAYAQFLQQLENQQGPVAAPIQQHYDLNDLLLHPIEQGPQVAQEPRGRVIAPIEEDDQTLRNIAIGGATIGAIVGGFAVHKAGLCAIQ